MCGIIGYTGVRDAMPILIAGLDTLAYRGYDSAGVAIAREGGISLLRAAGKLENLKRRIEAKTPPQGTAGIGHTRWATHGAPTEANAHPHTDRTRQVAVVHNGIIENATQLRAELEAQGVVFSSETDTEVIPHLLALYLRETGEPTQAIRRTVARLQGAYALAVLFASCPQEIYAVRARSPLALVKTEDAAILASDVTALLTHGRAVAYPEEGVIVRMTPTEISYTEEGGVSRKPTYLPVTWAPQSAGKAGYRHYMEKELCEVPDAIEKTLASWEAGERMLSSERAQEIEEVVFVGCGSAYHAGLLAAVGGEGRTGIRMRAEIASELRYKKAVFSPHTLTVAVSQSGETADTLAAQQKTIESGCESLAIINVRASAIARMAHRVFYTQAGPEIAVATTKAYCAQVVATSTLEMELLLAKGKADTAHSLREDLRVLPAACRAVASSRCEIAEFVPFIQHHEHIFFIGRGTDAAVCREGALKLKEITYLHAEAFDAGELKHGTISLIEQGTPVIAVMTQPHLAPQMESNIREVMARGARVLLFAAQDIVPPTGTHLYRLPPCGLATAPLLAAYAMQWLAYEVAIKRGGDPDMPRNLAKSVTVE